MPCARKASLLACQPEGEVHNQLRVDVMSGVVRGSQLGVGVDIVDHVCRRDLCCKALIPRVE